jgi:hypothetical protein
MKSRGLNESETTLVAKFATSWFCITYRPGMIF